MIVAADPGETTALAVFLGPTPGVTSIADLTPAFALEFLTWATAEADWRGEELVLVVEDQYAKIRYVPGKDGKPPTPTIDLPALISVVRSAEIWVVCARLLEIRVVRVLGTVWQGPMLRAAPKVDDGGKTLTTKQRARIVVASTWPKVYRFNGLPTPETMKLVSAARLNEHIRDAMLMGQWQRLHGDKPAAKSKRAKRC